MRRRERERERRQRISNDVPTGTEAAVCLLDEWGVGYRQQKQRFCVLLIVPQKQGSVCWS